MTANRVHWKSSTHARSLPQNAGYLPWRSPACWYSQAGERGRLPIPTNFCPLPPPPHAADRSKLPVGTPIRGQRPGNFSGAPLNRNLSALRVMPPSIPWDWLFCRFWPEPRNGVCPCRPLKRDSWFLHPAVRVPACRLPRRWRRRGGHALLLLIWIKRHGSKLKGTVKRKKREISEPVEVEY